MTLYPTIAPRKTFTRASFLLQLSVPLGSFCIATKREREILLQERTQRSYLRLLFWTGSPAFTTDTANFRNASHWTKSKCIKCDRQQFCNNRGDFLTSKVGFSVEPKVFLVFFVFFFFKNLCKLPKERKKQAP